jgi:hypothetical protein
MASKKKAYQTIRQLAEDLQSLTTLAVKEYNSEVNSIISVRSVDQQHIGRTLDGMLGFCSNAQMVRIFRKLCRYYYAINPHATAKYVLAYRDMWDSNGVA